MGNPIPEPVDGLPARRHWNLIFVYFLPLIAVLVCWTLFVRNGEELPLHAAAESAPAAVVPGEVVQIRFNVENTSGEPVRIDRMVPDCTCIGPDRRLPRLIAAGEDGEFVVYVDTAGKTDPLHFRVLCYCGRFLVGVLEETVPIVNKAA